MKIEEFLKSQDITLTELARRAGVPQPVLYRFHLGQRGIALATAAKIVKATGGMVGFSDLLPTDQDNGDKSSASSSSSP